MKKNSIITYSVLFLILISGFVIVSINVYRKNVNVPIIQSYDRISIRSNSKFQEYCSTGDGTIENPFILENLTIKSTSNTGIGIEIRGTSAYFIIRNCIIETQYIGIHLNNIDSGTGIIQNNTCVGLSGDGGGIGVSSSDSHTITNNTCINFAQGIHFNNGHSCKVSNNIIKNSTYQGINLRYSNSNEITQNTILNSEEHGLAIVGTSSNNIVFMNTFQNNSNSDTYSIDGERTGNITSQGYDEGTGNLWYNITSEIGNYWSDYDSEIEYEIDGPAASKDKFPLE